MTNEVDTNKEISVKQRFLMLQELLTKYTDEKNMLTLDEILTKFYQEYGIMVGKKAIRDDLKELEESSFFNVIAYQDSEGKKKEYCHEVRLFEIHELRLLIDAVSSAKFITKAETETLVKKIKNLTSQHLAKHLDNRIILPENSKSENSQIKYNVHELHTAILSHKIIEFQYGKYNLKKQFKLNRNGEFYKLKPYALIWNNEFYYLIGEYLPKGDIRHYRVDRIKNVNVLEETFIPDPGFDATKYREKLFHMYSGEESLIEIEFAADLINVVIDHFGRGVNIRPIGDDKFRVSKQAIISDGLVKWLLTWGSEAKVLEPPFLVDRMRQESEKLYHHYH